MRLYLRKDREYIQVSINGNKIVEITSGNNNKLAIMSYLEKLYESICG